MSRFLLAFFALILAVFYAALSPAVTSRFEAFDFPINASTRVLLVTAHPDDECMFFAPTVLTLRARKVEVYSICLSVGDQDGLGDIRRSELEKSLDVLGIPEDRRTVVDSPVLPDNITMYWDELAIHAFVEPYIISHNITTLITFDAHGISGHPNHGSIPLALASLLTNWEGSIARPSLYSLQSVGLASKYIGPATLIGRRITKLYNQLYARLTPLHPQPALIAISGHKEYATAHRAMRQHASQLVWFRYLYVAFSRYMWVNELHRFKMDIVRAEPSDSES